MLWQRYRKIPKINLGAYILPFSLCCTLYLRAIFQEGGGSLYLKRRFNGGFFALPVWGAYIWRGLYMEGHILGILRYAAFQKKGKKTIKMKAHTIRAEFVCLLLEPIFFRCSSHHHYFIISTSLPLFSQDLFELMHVLPQKSKFHHQAPF